MENLRIGVVEVEHDERTTHDHLSCSVCSWQLGVSPREYAVRIAHRHDDSHQPGAVRARAVAAGDRPPVVRPPAARPPADQTGGIM
ncbi:MAG: hypothetical protein ACRDP6_36640 [Actinoallomurus sp.]